MAKSISIFTIICLILIFGLQEKLYSASKINPVLMQDHIEKVKRKKPKEYQVMLEKAGGTVTDCTSCHTDLNKKKN